MVRGADARAFIVGLSPASERWKSDLNYPLSAIRYRLPSYAFSAYSTAGR
jgi:hypothetical protein